MKIFVTGGTGFVGRRLCGALLEAGHEVTVLTRPGGSGKEVLPGADRVEADPLQPGPWQESAAEHQAVINLAGEPINGRWNDKRKQNILDSRLMVTQHLAAACAAARARPIRLLNASAVGYYGPRGDEELDETASSGPDFLAAVASQWEGTAGEAERFGARVALCRFGIVLGKNGGALFPLVRAGRRGLGAPMGNGRQWMSWIHIDDLVGALLFLLDLPELTGAFNFTAPSPVTNREFTETLNQVLGKTPLLPFIPGFLLRLRFGEFAGTLLRGQRILPRRLEESGFVFRFPDLTSALSDLVAPDKLP